MNLNVNLKRDIPSGGYFDFKEYNKKIFKETMDFIKNSDDNCLKADILNSIEHQQMIPDDVQLLKAMPVVNYNGIHQVTVEATDTIDAALRYYNKAKAVILNFASWTTPGGMVWQGSGAQEESICRQTTLYPCISDLKMKKQFYNRHKSNYNTLGNNDIIYTPGVDILRFGPKGDESSLTPPHEFINPGEYGYPKVDVITCAAPNLRPYDPNDKHYNGKTISESQIFSLMYNRARAIITVATAMGDEILITGAFGCGVFKNPPYVVARAWKKALYDTQSPFKKVIYAIPDHNSDNYKAFAETVF